jgi:hypothetical protein
MDSSLDVCVLSTVDVCHLRGDLFPSARPLAPAVGGADGESARVAPLGTIAKYPPPPLFLVVVMLLFIGLCCSPLRVSWSLESVSPNVCGCLLALVLMCSMLPLRVLRIMGVCRRVGLSGCVRFVPRRFLSGGGWSWIKL